MRSIGVFCSSRTPLRADYTEAARRLGSEIGRRGARLVYGGSKCGLMKVTADAVHAAGGKTLGIIPARLRARGLQDDCDFTFYTADLSDRKAAMIREADVFVALPGGVGTLDEIFTVAADSTLGYHDRAVVLYNVGGYWDATRTMLEGMAGEGMLPADIAEHIKYADDEDSLYSLIF